MDFKVIEKDDSFVESTNTSSEDNSCKKDTTVYRNTYVRLPLDMHKKLRMLAIQKDVSISEFVRAALVTALKNNTIVEDSHKKVNY